MNDSMLSLPGLSPVCGKTIVAKFDGGLLSSDAGILVLREVEQRLRVADRLDAQAFDVAYRTVRHIASAAHKNRHPCRRDEDDDPSSPADVLSRPEHFTACTPAHSALRHLKDGASCPRVLTPPVNPQTFSTQHSGLSPGADEPRLQI